jgi:predicted enzyme related to lactoylglutathione lyase
MLRTVQWTLDVHDTARMADFWSQALGFDVAAGDDGCATLYAAGAHGTEPPISVWLQATSADKVGKNRCHPDLVASDGDVDREVERLLGLGASRVDIGQTDEEGLVVLADPEGNEFCVLRADPRDRYS